jgi:Tfp pilus assembly protein PilO
MQGQVQPSNMMLRSRVVTLLAGAGAIAYAFLIFVPGQQLLARQRQEIQQKRRQAAQANLLAQPIQQLQQELLQTEDYARHWRKQAPAGTHTSQAMGQVIAKAESNGVEILRLQPQDEAVYHCLRSLPIDLQLSGSYHSICGMLGDLETMRGHLWIEQLNLSHVETANDQLECTLKLIIFSDSVEFSG